MARNLISKIMLATAVVTASFNGVGCSREPIESTKKEFTLKIGESAWGLYDKIEYCGMPSDISFSIGKIRDRGMVNLFYPRSTKDIENYIVVFVTPQEIRLMPK